MMIRALQAKGVFLCHCQLAGEQLAVGLMALESPGQRSVQVWDRDDEGRSLTVELPEGEAIALTDIQLRIVDYGDFGPPEDAGGC